MGSALSREASFPRLRPLPSCAAIAGVEASCAPRPCQAASGALGSARSRTASRRRGAARGRFPSARAPSAARRTARRSRRSRRAGPLLGEQNARPLGNSAHRLIPVGLTQFITPGRGLDRLPAVDVLWTETSSIDPITFVHPYPYEAPPSRRGHSRRRRNATRSPPAPIARPARADARHHPCRQSFSRRIRRALSPRVLYTIRHGKDLPAAPRAYAETWRTSSFAGRTRAAPGPIHLSYPRVGSAGGAVTKTVRLPWRRIFSR